jgi:hypothetical protein
LHQAEKALPPLQRAVNLTSEMYDTKSVRLLPAKAALGIAHLQLGNRQMAQKYLAEADSLRSLHRNLGLPFEHPLQDLRQAVAAR